MEIKVIIADDHALVRDGIRAILERKTKDISVVAEASNGKEVLELARKIKPDVYIMDISMPVLNGIETTERLVKMDPKSKVVILSMHDDCASVEKSLSAGAKSFVIKVSSSDEIIKAVREVYNGKFYLCSGVSKYVVQRFLGKTSNYYGKAKPTKLTPKEREILQLIAEGHSSREIAKSLKLSVNTVHVHRNNIMRKLDVHKQADLIRYALKEGISCL
ncbi:MAG: response regulator transcription factor [Elusimicrobia bacterium]|nr:response regulator transcription factor [Elusimicrobiota bacterium]